MTRSDAPIGILMLDTRFPRIVGDIGNPATFPFPVLYRTVPAATPDRVIRQGAPALLEPFIEAAKGLVADGAVAITTSCGFLTVMQKDLASAVPVPVLTSSLFQVPMIDALLPRGKRTGILTVAATSLTDAHLRAARVSLDAPIGTTEGGGTFTETLLNNRADLDVAAAREDNLDAARALQKAHPDLGALVLECTNMGPYAQEIRAATGLPVYSIVDAICWLRQGLQARA